MRRITMVAVLALLAFPAAAMAQSDTAEKNAAKACKAERAKNPEAFKEKYGTNKSKSNAYGKCVSKKAKAKADDPSTAKKNAAKECKAERAQNAEAFKNKYGTNKNKSNAYGKCVSQKAKEKTQQS